MERIESFALPATFPEVLVPEQLQAFMKSCVQERISTRELRKRAQDEGYAPLWRPLPKLGARVYGFCLDVEGLQVPFVVSASVDRQQVCEPAAAWRARWPLFCRYCRGWGGKATPASRRAPEDFDLCSEGEKDPELCHRCGAAGLTKEGEGPCRACGWNFDSGEPND